MKRPVKPLQLPQPGFWLCVPVCYLPCRAGAAQHGASGLVGGTRPVRWAVRGPTARVRGGPGRGGCPVARGRLGLSPGFLPPGRRGLRGQGRPAGPSGASAMRSTLEAGGAAPVSCGRRGQGHHERPGAAAGPGRGGVPGRGRGSRHCQAHIRGLDPQVGCAQDGAPHLRREPARSKHSRGSFLPRRASPGTPPAWGKASWSSPPRRSRPARGRPPPRPPRAACRGRSSSCTWRAVAAAPSTSGPASAAIARPAVARG